MPPKFKKPVEKPLSGVALLKARMEAQRKAEEEQRKIEEELKRKEEEEIKLAEEQRKIDEEERENQKLKDKEMEKEKKSEYEKNKKKMQQFETLFQMHKNGMVIQMMSDELKEFISKKENEQEKINLKKKEKNEEKINNKLNDNLNENDILNKNVNENGGDVVVECDKMFETKYRSPICCVLGHVDTGKTSLLDKIRRTHVQEGEVGGITQQIGATYFPRNFLVEMAKKVGEAESVVNVPGLLMIDTPGHESFSNLRNRGSSVCDISILVVDIMHGLENQTRESIKLLKKKKCPFVIALNKIDKLYGWKSKENMNIKMMLESQKQDCYSEYRNRLRDIQVQLAEEEVNSEEYFENQDYNEFVSIVPVSAKTGDGIADLIYHQIYLTQHLMAERITYKNELQCTVLEVKPTHGFGTTIDVILVNGELNYGDNIVLCGVNGPFTTRIKTLLTPQIMKELRLKSEYQDHKKIKGSQCLKIVADGLDTVIPGTQLYVSFSEQDTEKYQKELLKEVKNVTQKISKDKIGVTVHSSSVGSLESLLEFLSDKDVNIPVGHIELGTVHKKSVTHTSLMKTKMLKYACILAFDVDIDQEAKNMAEKEGIKIFRADIIYHLFDSFTKHVKDYEKEQKEKNKNIAIFPVELKVLCCFNAKDPLVIGCRVMRGQLKLGTPLCIKGKTGLKIGTIIGMQVNNKDILIAKPGMDVAIKLTGKTTVLEKKTTTDEKGKHHEIEESKDQFVIFGRQFDKDSILTSCISRKSIDALKESFRDEMAKEDWELIIELKSEQKIC